MNLAKFPRRVYVREPTLIEYPPNFSKRWGGRGNVYIKRDDLPPRLRRRQQNMQF